MKKKSKGEKGRYIYVYVYTYIYTYIKDPTDFWSALFYLFLDLYEGQRQYFCSL